MEYHTKSCIHCGKDTKKGRFSDRKPVYICGNCYSYHNYAEIEEKVADK